MTSLIFTGHHILKFLEAKKPRCSYPYFIDEDNEEESVKATE
jgi:hypothetical protein